MSKNLSRDYLTIDRLYKDLNRLLYDKEYDKPELREALETLKKMRKNIAEKLES